MYVVYLRKSTTKSTILHPILDMAFRLMISNSYRFDIKFQLACTIGVCLEELVTYYFMQQLYTAIVPLVKIHFPNLNLKPIIEFDNENHFTNQRFCINEPSNNLYQHMYLKAMLGCSNLRYYEQFKVL